MTVALTATRYLSVARSVSEITDETSGREGNYPCKRGYYFHRAILSWRLVWHFNDDHLIADWNWDEHNPTVLLREQSWAWAMDFLWIVTYAQLFFLVQPI